MEPLAAFPLLQRRRIRGLLTDIDDTLSTEGQLTAAAYSALERLRDAGLKVIPVTGRPAGWCDHIARFWPVDAVVGENGAFAMRYDRQSRKLRTLSQSSPEALAERRHCLAGIGQRILAAVPGSALASDQDYRIADLAIDFCEDVPRLADGEVHRIVALLQAEGLTVKVSSIHVNAWFGDYDKLSMTRRLLAEEFACDVDQTKDDWVFCGDSPNDAPMFDFFPNAVGVANVADFALPLNARPRYVTQSRSGDGFVELAEALLAAR